MKLSCSAYQAGSCTYAQKILSGHPQNYGATSSTSTNTTGDSSHGIVMPTWTVEEVEGKISPNETEFGAESSTGPGSTGPGTCGYQQSGHISGSGGVGTVDTSGRGENSRRTSSSLSHHSDVHPDQKGNQSDSTSISKAPATSSCSPSESPAHRLSEHSRSRSKSVGEQQWTNLRAVMAWYARLRRIKRSKSNQRWMKLRTTVQLSGAIQTIHQKKATLKREDSFLKRFSTRQIPEAQETFEIGDEDGAGGGDGGWSKKGRKKRRSLPRSVVNPDGNFYFYFLMLLTFCVLYNLWTLIVRQSFPELQENASLFWILADVFCDLMYFLDIGVQFRTGYLEQGLMVYQTKKLANHYIGSKHYYLDLFSLVPTDLVQLYFGVNPMVRFPRFLKIYRVYNYYYMVESRTVYPNVLRVLNLIHILLLLAHWFGCFYYLISQAEKFNGDWGYPDPTKNPDFAPLTRKYLGSLYWSTLTLTTIGDLPQPHSNWQYLFTIVSYLIGVFIFATIVGQVGNVITNRNANRLEFERLLDGAKMYMRHHKVPRDMQRRVLRWYDYSWSRGRIQGGGDINTALGLLPDKLKTELALHVNLSVLKKVTIFQECQPEFLHDLVLKMKAYIFTPGDLICRKGEVAREMFIIADGILEVISETGKVLTTMQAGDFFGEIGILNLDGLNKRTADVRSVGYSELFSLSREDVLAAMKDYPEAQEILQTLGRKRLMEARKASAPVVKKPIPGGPIVGVVVEPKKTSPVHVGLTRSHSGHSNKELVDGGSVTVGPVDIPTGKRIVEKLRSDVKGLRNAIRKSRKSNSSKEDSSEPDSGNADGESGVPRVRKESTASITAKSFPQPRGVLKRMHNIASSDEKDKEPSTSQLVSAAPPSMKKISIASVVKRVQLPKPKASVGKEEPEIIGAGLPLFERLRLLKQKEERERKQQDERDAMMKTLIPSNLSLASPSASPIMQTKASIETPPMPKTTDPATALANVVERTRVERASISSNDSGSTISSPPSTSLPLLGTFSPKSTLLIGEAAAAAASKVTSEPITMVSGGTFPPVWTPSSSRSSCSTEPVPSSSVPSQLMCDRPSALYLRQQHASKNYGSVDDLSPEFSRLPFIKKLKILNERHKIAELLLSKSVNSVLTRSTSEGSNDNPVVAEIEEQLYSVQLGRRTQSNNDQLQIEGEDEDVISQYFSLHQQELLTPTSEDGASQLPGTLAESQQRDRMESIPSTSAATVKTSISQDSNATVCLINEPSNIIKSPSTTPSTVAKPKVRKRRKVKKPLDDGNGYSTEDSSPSPPKSPDIESNETPERRNLKSILKKLAESKGANEREQDVSDDKQLLKASTVEGYAARHRKFAKNVTFRRQAVTVVSPEGPTPTTIAAAARVLPQEMTTHDQSLVLGTRDHQQEILEGIQRETGLELQTADLLLIFPQLRTFSPENMKILSSLLMGKEEEVVESGRITTGENYHPTPFEGLKLAQTVLGIKTIIYEKLDEIQRKFQSRFDLLEQELRRRDEFISVLQHRFQDIEDENCENRTLRRAGNGISSTTRNNRIVDTRGIEADIEMDGDLEDEDEVEEYHRGRRSSQVQSSYLFSRGDSIDTVISAQDFDDEVFERAEIEYTEATAREGLSQPSGTSSSRDERREQSTRQERDGIGTDRTNYDVSSWAQDQDTIEMRDLGPAPWQLEFHRDKDSLPPPNGDSVAVEIGNTSTEYESTSSEEGELGRNNKLHGTVQLQERKVSLDDDDVEESQESANNEYDSDKSERESTDINHKNWEVQMLAKEMEKQEEKRKTTEDVVGEVRKLENDIDAIKVAFEKGNLSPTELDMLETVLQTKNKQMKVLFKALSVESGRPTVVAHRSSLKEESSPKSKVGRSHDDFRRGSGGSAHLRQTLATTSSFSGDYNPKTVLSFGGFTGPCLGEKTGKVSPGERLDLHRLVFSKKSSGVKRQASLCETSESTSKSFLRERRRESAGTVSYNKQPGGPRKSFLSRFSLVRQFTGRHSKHHQPVEESSGDQLEELTLPLSIQDEESPNSSNLSRKTSSSVGILPLISSTINSAISSSVKSDPGQATVTPGDTTTITDTKTTIVVLNTTSTTTTGSGGVASTSTNQGVYTIPNLTVPTSSSSHSAIPQESHSFPGESQPLLKK